MPVRVGRHDRREAKLQGQCPGFAALAGAIHDRMAAARNWRGALSLLEQLPALGRITGLTRREGELQGKPSTRGKRDESW